MILSCDTNVARCLCSGKITKIPHSRRKRLIVRVEKSGDFETLSQHL